jgi:hypothetical protein
MIENFDVMKVWIATFFTLIVTKLNLIEIISQISSAVTEIGNALLVVIAVAFSATKFIRYITKGEENKDG